MFLKVEQEHMIIEDTKIDNIRKIIFCQILGYQATLTTFLLNQAELDLFSSPNFFSCYDNALFKNAFWSLLVERA